MLSLPFSSRDTITFVKLIGPAGAFVLLTRVSRTMVWNHGGGKHFGVLKIKKQCIRERFTITALVP
jgi:hypothetical protein